MDSSCTHLSYKETGYFSRIVCDYLDNHTALHPFIEHEVSLEGLRASIAQRKKFPTNRNVLTTYLEKQYKETDYPIVQNNITLLSEENTFTITTAHQPAIFTGTLYFIYKILHAIRLAKHLAEKMPGYNFVPVFYMGCEDADLEELGKIYLNGEKITWDTKQTGAVGRMKTAGLEKIVHRIEGELNVKPYGQELSILIRQHYLNAPNLQTGTFHLLNELFSAYGLIVLVPDDADLKRLMIPVFEDDLFKQTAATIVEDTVEKLHEYKVQANPREINLFYLADGIRARIVQQQDKWIVVGTSLSFTSSELKNELNEHPEHFSPNVILRGLFQETILPNIAFIGGGGELAYWLELKNLFRHFGVPYPVLVLRNSFLILEKKWKEKMQQLGLTEKMMFLSEKDLMDIIVKRASSHQLSLEEEILTAGKYYDHLKKVATTVDRTLEQHVSALHAKAVKPLQVLEKKLLRAEKRKYEAQERSIEALRQNLFPHDSLQERIENFMPFYAKYGREFIETIEKNSLALEQQFTVLTLE
ncbi:MAG TPA: bacillithiol biosynthesis cysteine-adding enzyme BshC [Flavitalea sp.]|nr:bacillithiol biosynthesis cysteine-adding enzyme BshC [Flavitalea sp.]